MAARFCLILAATLTVSVGLTGCATTHDIKPQIASGVDFSRAEPYEVKLSSFDFSPTEIRLDAGKPYALKLVNVANTGHDFTAPDFFAAARIAPEDADRIADGQVDLDSGESAVIHLVPKAGEYRLVCTHAGHNLLGMTGTITVS